MPYMPPLQVITSASMRKRIEAISCEEDISLAQVVRDILDAGIEAREQVSDSRRAAR